MQPDTRSWPRDSIRPSNPTYKTDAMRGKVKKNLKFKLPFHAAEQSSKVRRNDSAEYPVRGYKHP
jgi:hypothetical protein